MMHAKLFTCRLALAAGLMLGWTSGAAADIRLSVDREKVREEAGRTEITVTAKNYASAAPGAPLADVANDTYVSLQSSMNGLNSRFRIAQTTLVIPKGESQASDTIIFTPIDDDLMGNDSADDGSSDDLLITISGSAGATAVQPTTITLLDNDKASTAIHLTFSQTTLSKRAGATEIVVTAELDGAVMTSDASFQLRIDETNSTVTRDADYFAQLGSITIRRRRASGTATITITPNNQGVGHIELIGAPSPVAGLNIVPNQIDLTDANLSIQSLTATPTSIRENAGRTEITLTVTLAEAPVVDETVSFDLVAPSSGTLAVRDTDYRATLPPGRAITIAAGEIEETATLTVTPLNNEIEDGDKSLGVKATASGGSKQTDITILDDETLSESITLSVNPDTISEDAGATPVAITAILTGTGKVLDEDVSLIFLEDSAGTAIRDTDYTRPVARLTIPAGQVQGSGTVTITPIDDGEEEADETIILRVASNPENEYGDPIAVGTATLTLKDTGKRVEPPPTGDTTPVFAGDAADLSATVGTAITPVVLPAATGDGTLTYSVSALPAGLVFNTATRTLSGTPTVAGEQTIIYTVIDGDEVAREGAAMTFTITVAAKPSHTIAVQSLTSSHSSIREDAGTTEITLTVTLAEAAPANESVVLDLVAPSTGTPAVRDTDYEARLPRGKAITIPAGETKGTMTLTFISIDNDKVDGSRALGVQASASGGSAQTDITITDDETAIMSITLSVNPHAISEQDDRTRIEVTATLKGKELAENVTVTVEIDEASTATRDLDYGALFNKQIVIQAGSITGSTLFIVQPTVDTLAEGDETIRLIGKINEVVEDEAEITLSDPAEVPSDAPGSSTVVADRNYTYTVGTKITLLLPEQTVLVSGQPAGLAFDEATRTLSGTPTEATDGAVLVSYVLDQDGDFDFKEFTITINPASSDPPDSPGSSTVVADRNYTYTVGTKITLLLPEQTVLVSGQPAGLAFDEATRTLSGTPTEATDGAVLVSYVLDQDGDFDFKEFTITINPASSDPPDSPGS
ncbi:MAG: Ig domain-containing protein, partial [Gemmatimonadota bacterium]|nr:Ig domain-containing protein [Gemmatimonadota bacterium]